MRPENQEGSEIKKRPSVQLGDCRAQDGAAGCRFAKTNLIADYRVTELLKTWREEVSPAASATGVLVNL